MPTPRRSSSSQLTPASRSPLTFSQLASSVNHKPRAADVNDATSRPSSAARPQSPATRPQSAAARLPGGSPSTGAAPPPHRAAPSCPASRPSSAAASPQAPQARATNLAFPLREVASKLPLYVSGGNLQAKQRAAFAELAGHKRMLEKQNEALHNYVAVLERDTEILRSGRVVPNHASHLARTPTAFRACFPLRRAATAAVATAVRRVSCCVWSRCPRRRSIGSRSTLRSSRPRRSACPISRLRLRRGTRRRR